MTEQQLITQVEEWRKSKRSKELRKLSYQAMAMGVVEGVAIVVKTVGVTYIASQVWNNLNKK